jgi:hypothetical protein
LQVFPDGPANQDRLRNTEKLGGIFKPLEHQPGKPSVDGHEICAVVSLNPTGGKGAAHGFHSAATMRWM